MHLVSDYIRAAGKGTCYVCRAHRRSKDEVILDFERDIDFEGALQVCAPCIAEAAKLTGAIDAAVEKVEYEASVLRAENASLLLALDAAEDALRGVEVFKVNRPARRKAVEAEPSGD